MIDRKGLWILILLCLATTAAAIWRLSLLPDWTQLPMFTPDGPRVRNGLVLFVPPLTLLFMMAVSFGQRWFITGPDEAIQARQRRNRLVWVWVGVIVALAQAFNISRSLGYGLSLDRETFGRTVIVVTGVLLMMQGNNMPKLPWISTRIAALNLDPWQSARSLRFAGRLCVALGLAMIVGVALLPVRAMAPIVVTLSLFYVGAIWWHAFRLKREPSPLP